MRPFTWWEALIPNDDVRLWLSLRYHAAANRFGEWVILG